MTPLERVAWKYGWFAERYGWPPSVVDAQPLWVMLQLPVYARAADEATVILQREAQELAEREAAARRR